MPASLDFALTGGLDHETVPVRRLAFEVTDIAGTVSYVAVDVLVQDVNEAAPVFGQESFAFTVSETAADQTVVGTADATDADTSQTLTYSFEGGNEDGAFAIDGSGVITIADASLLDYETAPTRALSVLVSDGESPADQVWVTVTVADGNDAPTVSVTNDGATISELTPTDTPTPIAVSAVDVDMPWDENANNGYGGPIVQSLTYEIVADSSDTTDDGQVNGAFGIDESGQVFVADTTLLDFADAATHTLTVRVSDDGAGYDDGPAFTDVDVTVNLAEKIEIVLQADPTTLDENEQFDVWHVPAAQGTLQLIRVVDSDSGSAFVYNTTADANGVSPDLLMIVKPGATERDNGPGLDYEAGPVRTIVFEAIDTETGETVLVQTTVSLLDHNEFAPVVDAEASTLSGEVIEHSVAGAVVATVVAADGDTYQTLGYEITAGNDDGAFAIDENGTVTVADGSLLDYETETSRELTVTISDDGGDVGEVMSVTATVMVGILDGADGPIAATYAFEPSFSERTPSGESTNTVVYALAEPAADPESEVYYESDVSFSIESGNDDGAFAITADGTIVVADATRLDAENAATRTLTVRITDSAAADAGQLPLFDEIEVTLTTRPGIDLPITVTIPEGTTSGLFPIEGLGNVAVYNVVGGSDAYDVSTTTIGGESAFVLVAQHQLDGVTDTPLDAETDDTRILLVEAKDWDAELTVWLELTVVASDVNEFAPEVEGYGGYGGVVTVNEGETGLTGAYVVASDADVHNTLSYAIVGGNDDGAFEVDSYGGVSVADGSLLDHETMPSRTVTVRVTDNGGDVDGQADRYTDHVFTFSVADVAEAPTVDQVTTVGSVPVLAPEGLTTGVTVSASDQDGDAVTLSLVGDAQGFEITSEGEIVVAAGASLAVGSVELTVRATDDSDGNLSSDTTVTIEVRETVEIGPLEIAEFDDEEIWALANIRGSLDLEEIIGGNDDGVFTLLTLANGRLLFDDPAETGFDFDLTPSRTLLLQATDSANGDRLEFASLTINVVNGNEHAPVATGFTADVTENEQPEGAIGQVTATDADPNETAFTYAIVSGNDDGAFAIDADGHVTVTDATLLDFETAPVRELQVTVTDDGTGGATGTELTSEAVTVTVNVLDGPEAPTVGSDTLEATITTGKPSFDSPAGIIASTVVGDIAGRATAAIVSGNESEAFVAAVFPAFGSQPRLFIGLDDPSALTVGVHTLGIVITGDGGLTTAVTATITVTEPITIDSGLSIDEVGDRTTVAWETMDADLGDRAVVGGYGGYGGYGGGAVPSFWVTSESDNGYGGYGGSANFDGLVRIGDLDAESASQASGYPLTVSVVALQAVEDAQAALGAAGPKGDTAALSLAHEEALIALYASAEVITVTAAVTDVNEFAPEVAVPTDATVSESAEDGTVVGQVTATDADASDDAFTFAITGGEQAAAFAIDETGQITVVDSSLLDYEAGETVTIQVTVTDVSDNVDGTIDGEAIALRETVEEITVTLTDADETPMLSGRQRMGMNPDGSDDYDDIAIAEGGASLTIPENLPEGSEVADLDADQPVTWAIVGGVMADAFTIDADGRILVSEKAMLDFEKMDGPITLEITATPQAGSDDTAELAMVLDLANRAEPPQIASRTVTIPENTGDGTPVMRVPVTFAEAGAELAFAITGGKFADAFSIDAETGRVRVADKSMLDFETTKQLAFAVTVTDTASGLSSTATMYVRLSDRLEAGEVIRRVTNLPEDAPTGSGVIRALVNGEAGRTYLWSIVGGNDDGAFAINEVNGRITVADGSKLDYETQDMYALQVKATDSERPDLSDVGIVKVNITDVEEAVEGFLIEVPASSLDSALPVRVGTIPGLDESLIGFALANPTTGDAFQIVPTDGRPTIEASYGFDGNPTEIFISGNANVDLATLPPGDYQYGLLEWDENNLVETGEFSTLTIRVV